MAPGLSAPVATAPEARTAAPAKAKATPPRAKKPQTATSQTAKARAARARAAQAAKARAAPAAQAQAREAPAPQPQPQEVAGAAPDILGLDELNPKIPVSQVLIDVAGWVIASKDNRKLPFAIIDKESAQILVFDRKGRVRGVAAVLLGSAIGDDSAPGVADRELKDIPMDERTTPAGRFYAAYGPAIGHDEALWIDYNAAISLHPLEQSSRWERRRKRLASETVEDNRITHGCINVSPAFYARVIRPIIKTRAIFYVLPETTPIEQAIPGYRQPEAQEVASVPSAGAKPTTEPSAYASLPSPDQAQAGRPRFSGRGAALSQRP